MNFLKTFAKFLFLFLFLGFAGLLSFREGMLFLASQQVGQQAQRMTQLNRWQDAINQCTNPQIASEGPAFSAIQLRFVDQEEYVLEVVCQNTVPVEVLRKSLPMGVKKTTGSAGISFTYPQRELNGEITFSLWGQNRMLQSNSQDSKIERSWGKSEIRSGIVASSCAAHGLTCCDAIEEVVSGETWSDGVLDCPQNCAQQCLQRPTLLSFQSDPSVDHETRKVFVGGTSTLVLLGYSFDDTESPLAEVTIDFGDGDVQTFTKAQQSQISKEYSCPSGSCQYTATIKAKDVRGIESNISRLSTMVFVFGNP